MSLSGFYLRSQRAAQELDRLIAAGLIVAFGIADADLASFDDRMSFEVETDAGMLRGVLYHSEHIQSDRNGGRGYWSPGWVHFRFDDVKAAAAVVSGGSLNTYSGKWNYHFTGDALTWAVDVGYMVHNLKKINARNFRRI